MAINIQDIALICMVAFSTLFQIISIFRGDTKSATKLEKEREKALKKLNNKEIKLLNKVKKIEENKGVIENANNTKG